MGHHQNSSDECRDPRGPVRVIVEKNKDKGIFDFIGKSFFIALASITIAVSVSIGTLNIVNGQVVQCSVQVNQGNINSPICQFFVDVISNTPVTLTEGDIIRIGDEVERRLDFFCEECLGGKIIREVKYLIKPRSDIRLIRGDSRSCGQYDWYIEYAPNGNDWNSIKRDELFNPEAAGQISLPKFCGKNGKMGWAIIDQPRVYYSSSTVVTARDEKGVPTETESYQAPYVMFTAVEERTRMIANAYFIYIDAQSGRPNSIEIRFESRGAKALISREGNGQLVSNLKLDSDNKQITFQVGERAHSMTIAGFDIGPSATPAGNAGAAPNLRDASGAYVIELTQNGAVHKLRRR